MATVTEYRVSNLAELLEAVESAVNESGRGAHEIYIDNGDWNCISFALESETLTDGSAVYNARFGVDPARANRPGSAQKYGNNAAASIANYFRSVKLADDSFGITSVNICQNTLANYLELAFLAGARSVK
jgi:hypothetical protein